MEGSRGRRTSMVVVVAILVGLTSINVGGVKGYGNCDAYLARCAGYQMSDECCSTLQSLVTNNVPCFCTYCQSQGVSVNQAIQNIKVDCPITVRHGICSKGHKIEAFSVTKWAVGLILLCIVTIIIPLK